MTDRMKTKTKRHKGHGNHPNDKYRVLRLTAKKERGR